MEERVYIAIDLKSFFASVECVDLGLNPLQVNLVVADESRTDKTICLAVTPALKTFGIPGRPRLFQVVQKVSEINAQRLRNAPNRHFTGKSRELPELLRNPSLAVDYIVVRPRMSRYMEVSSRIYSIYLKYISPEHIHVYSIDEVFIDATQYLRLYKLAPRDLAIKLIRDVLADTGITATAGIGTNLYLCKIAMDIVAKRMPPDKDGVRLAELNEYSYRELLWAHKPITDFWRVGHGTAAKLQKYGMFTMGDVARMSHVNEELLYSIFGINAELLIDHAWGWEPCTIEHIKAYKPENSSLCSGQVLQEPYTFHKARIVVAEMADALALDLVGKSLVTDQLLLDIAYDADKGNSQSQYKGPVVIDGYGRQLPKGTHGSINLGEHTSSTKIIVSKFLQLFDASGNKCLLVRKITLGANHVITELQAEKQRKPVQLELFTDWRQQLNDEQQKNINREREKRLQNAIIDIKRKMGKNALIKGMDLLDGATAMERNKQVGGHKA